MIQFTQLLNHYMKEGDIQIFYIKENQDGIEMQNGHIQKQMYI